MNATVRYHLTKCRDLIAKAQKNSGLMRSICLDHARAQLNTAYAVWSECVV